MSLFRTARFHTSVADLVQLPTLELPEIAFAGRSNAGKSTVINTLADHKRLAFASKTPGRTQLLNFFELVERDERRQEVLRGFLVDLPGYGFARADPAARATWDALVGGYVATRAQLRGLVIVMDARRPFMPGDEALLQFVSTRPCALHVLLNKADQLSTSEKHAALRLAQARVAALGPHASTQLFSGLKKTGVPELQQVLEGWLAL